MRRRAQLALKRGIDLLGAATALLLLAPAFGATALLVRARLGSPIFFRQIRPGLRGELFTLVKFRTMRDLRAGERPVADDGLRLGRVGRFLRATSLDELPTLWNVLRGDMSLVGPRPLLVQYLDRYTPQQARRHEMRPGITGWAQIHGRNALPWKERLAMDVWYVDHFDLLLDLRILVETVRHVLLRRGIHAAGHATMVEFMGDEATA